MAKHTFEAKLAIVCLVRDGKPIGPLSREYRIREGMVLEWVRKYTLYGESGLQKKPNLKATPEFKEEIVRIVLEKKIPSTQVVLQYGVSTGALETWVRLVRKEGYAALYHQKPRGRPTKMLKRSNKKEPPSELEKLKAENARLRAENALLKKVTALVREREAHDRMNGQKPSKN